MGWCQYATSSFPFSCLRKWFKFHELLLYIDCGHNLFTWHDLMQDHLALMMELLGKMPRKVTLIHPTWYPSKQKILLHLRYLYSSFLQNSWLLEEVDPKITLTDTATLKGSVDSNTHRWVVYSLTNLSFPKLMLANSQTSWLLFLILHQKIGQRHNSVCNTLGSASLPPRRWPEKSDLVADTVEFGWWLRWVCKEGIRRCFLLQLIIPPPYLYFVYIFCFLWISIIFDHVLN